MKVSCEPFAADAKVVDSFEFVVWLLPVIALISFGGRALLCLYSFTCLSCCDTFEINNLVYTFHRGLHGIVVLGVLNFLAGAILGSSWVIFFLMPNLYRYVSAGKIYYLRLIYGNRFRIARMSAFGALDWFPRTMINIGKRIKIYSNRFGLLARFSRFCIQEPTEVTIYTQYFSYETSNSDVLWYGSPARGLGENDNQLLYLIRCIIAWGTGPVRFLS